MNAAVASASRALVMRIIQRPRKRENDTFLTFHPGHDSLYDSIVLLVDHRHSHGGAVPIVLRTLRQNRIPGVGGRAREGVNTPPGMLYCTRPTSWRQGAHQRTAAGYLAVRNTTARLDNHVPFAF